MFGNGRGNKKELFVMDINEINKQMIESVVKCLENKGLEYAIIGAFALKLHKIKLDRMTMDADFAVIFDGDQEDLKEILSKYGFDATSIPHRFTFNKSAKVDVIPVSEKRNVVYWPTGEKMDLFGLKEAILNAEELKFGNDENFVVLKVAAIPLIVVIKIRASIERLEGGDITSAKKHISDIIACLRQYEEEGVRRFEYFDRLPEVEDEFMCSGAYLLGVDLHNYLSKCDVSRVVDDVNKCLKGVVLSQEDLMLIKCFLRGIKDGKIERHEP